MFRAYYGNGCSIILIFHQSIVKFITIFATCSFQKFNLRNRHIISAFLTSFTSYMFRCSLLKVSMFWTRYGNFLSSICIDCFRIIIFTSVNNSCLLDKFLCCSIPPTTFWTFSPISMKNRQLEKRAVCWTNYLYFRITLNSATL